LFQDLGKRFVVKALGAMDLADPMQIARYVATVRRLPFSPGVVVFDPLRDLHSKNEDSSGEMAPIYGALRALRTVLGCSVIFVHHSTKSTKDTDSRRGGQKLRGSSALHGAVDAGLYMTHPTKTTTEGGQTTMSCSVESEVKAAASVGDFALALEVFDSPNGEAVRAQWVFSRDRDTEDDPAIRARHAKEDAMVLAVLRQAHEKAPRGHPPIAKTALALQAGGRKVAMLEAIERLHAARRIRFVAAPGGRALYQHVQPEAPAPTAGEPDAPDLDGFPFSWSDE
jgi:RecA-family ATPase